MSHRRTAHARRFRLGVVAPRGGSSGARTFSADLAVGSATAYDMSMSITFEAQTIAASAAAYDATYSNAGGSPVTFNGDVAAASATAYDATYSVVRSTVTPNHLATAASTADGTSIATASVSPGSNRLVLIGICASRTGGAESPTGVSGNGLTWVQVGSTVTINTRTLAVYRAMGASPSAGAITVSYTSSHASFAWSVVEFSGVDTSGTNGSGAVVQSGSNTASPGTSVTATLSAFEHANNVAIGFFGSDSNANAFTVGSGFTQQGQASQTSNNARIMSETATNDNTVDATCTSSNIGVIAIEVKAN